ncbi:uncharacterized protein K452DRAFT_125935 [Aplosporella prunicola CBS 121167]|uniref:Sterol regulatory element-binding protein cleavage-activating protein n=1 Tax=Aplosporella prunicola CBS 121167 TaxID=1176127 RepID=A0A6A6BSL8_9PEZI|nr:uncharacterized protein K452DRAFT_125935 [Aplosporella prunicola CBS 121167]KAF2145817.1 hypothetical protein K452DRAFT_125935 [Aplosporella prunicola CBS 121167]
MIWYLLYAFRGTTEPPKLSPEHPIRKAFARYGTATARHWLLSLLLSVAVAVLLCYPVVFLYESPAPGGQHHRPHHVWTSVRAYDGPPDVTPDVGMRQLWVHGSYMKALDSRVLREALSIQDKLIGRGFGLPGGRAGDARDGALDGACAPEAGGNALWGYHSPLMYWNCSMAALEADTDILHTINSQEGRLSYMNFTLQPTSLFAGKSFNGTRLLAADALVITLMDRTGGAVTDEFDRRSRMLTSESPDPWSFYPPTGSTYRHQLYEFRYQPLSINDASTLILAYSLMLFYVLFSLRKLKAVKSVFGLFCTVIAQMFISICASFTVCGLLKINLTSVPGEAYPFVVLVIGLENMFRLINAVLESPAHMPTVSRVANALGDVGHLSLAAATQNLLILWLLSKIVSPGVAPACAFAAVALVFDFLFHLTFFVAVLSVDVRRMELQDSLDRINLATQRKLHIAKHERRTWTEALVRESWPFSTRTAGTIALVFFILALNWHFFDHDSKAFSLVYYLQWLRKSGKRRKLADVVTPPPINQARTPEAWLKMQDHKTAKELLNYSKPGAHSIIANIFEPLAVVMKDSDRRGFSQTQSIFFALRSLAERHFFPFAVVVVFVIATVTLLMNYLLWNEIPDEDSDSGTEAELPLSVKTLPRSHELDVVKLWSCGQGHLVAISLDRLISIWCLDQRTHIYSHVVLQPGTLSPPVWPIIASSIDDSGQWLALCTDAGRVALWSLTERRFVMSKVLSLRGQMPIIFAFSLHQMDDVERLSLVVVTPDGRLNNLDFRSGQLWTHQVSEGQLSNAHLTCCVKGRTRVISVSKTGAITMTYPLSGEWVSEALDMNEDRKIPNGTVSKVRYTYPIPSLCMIAAVRTCEVDLVDLPTRTVIYTFQTGQIKGQSLRILYAQRKICGCHSPAVQTFSITYTDSETQNCMMQTYSPNPDSANGQICLRPVSLLEEGQVSCTGFERATEALHWVNDPGNWESTKVPSIIGVRKRPATPPASVVSTSSDASYFANYANGGMKHRRRDSVSRLGQLGNASGGSSARPNMSRTHSSETEEWEAWTLSATGDLHTTPLFPGDAATEDEEQLFVAKPGPMVRVGKRSVAVGFGNTLKIITLGNERFEEGTKAVDPAVVSLAWRKRAMARRAGPAAHMATE